MNNYNIEMLLKMCFTYVNLRRNYSRYGIDHLILVYTLHKK